MAKFQKHFKSNLEKLKLAESEVRSGPKFANCFLDLTLFLGIQLENLDSSAHREGIRSQDCSLASPQGSIRIQEFLSTNDNSKV